MTVLQGAPGDGGAVQSRIVGRLALLACGLALVLLGAALLLLASPAGQLPKGPMSREELAIRLISRLGPPVLAGLICLRRPTNPYGWVWSAYGLGWAVVGFTDAYKLYVSAGAQPLWRASPIAWVGGIAIPSLFALTALILLLFPDGRPPSRRWYGFAWTIGAIGLLGTVAAAVRGAVGDTPREVADFAITALLFAILVSAVSLLLRFRRARGQQRQQLKWLAYGGGLFAALLFINLVDLQAPRLWNAVLETLTFGALYVGVGMAVLRYRLVRHRPADQPHAELRATDRHPRAWLRRGGPGAGAGVRRGRPATAELGGRRRDAWHGGAVSAGPRPHPGCGGPALQPPPL